MEKMDISETRLESSQTIMLMLISLCKMTFWHLENTSCRCGAVRRFRFLILNGSVYVNVSGYKKVNGLFARLFCDGLDNIEKL